MTALSPLLIPAAVPVAAPTTILAVECAPAADRSILRAGTASPVTGTANFGAASLIADTLFRRVFIYDTTARAYRASTDTSGPQNGIRFVLYTLSGYGLPTVPLSPDGWFDLSDQSAGAVLKLRSQISSGTSTVADYLVTLSGTKAADTAQLAGTVTDGTRTFSLRDSTAGAGVTGSVAFQVSVSAHLSDSLDGFSLDMVASRTTFDPFDYNDNLDFTFTSAAQTIRMVGAIRTYCLQPSTSLTVSVNGAAYATIANGTVTPNVTLVGGQTATADEAQALLGMRDAQRQLFLWLGALFAPSKALLP